MKKNFPEFLSKKNPIYNDKEKLIQYNNPIPPNPVHSVFKNKTAHHILDSLEYAVWLFEYEKNYSKKIDSIIKRVLSLQQNNPLKNHYGLWPIYLEEPLDKMLFPDPNITVFTLTKLLPFYKNYRHIIPKDTLYMIESACFAAATAIVNRNTTLQYSHIITEECYVCIFCGELFQRPEFVNYGVHKFEKFLNFVLFCGDFFEFNSPLYSLAIAEYLYRIQTDIQNPQAVDISGKLNKIIWKSLSGHYHHTTEQLVGPFSRTETDFLSKNLKTTLSIATENRVSMPDNSNIPNKYSFNKITAKCPPQFYPFFSGEKNIEYSQRLIFQGSTYPFFSYSYTATTYILPKYTLGSYNRQEFWKERRPLISYFGTKESPFCAKVTCLFDGEDFTSALLHCVQTKNSVLGHINFATNHGIHHFDDRKLTNGKIRVSDLRMRFIIKGNISELETQINTNKISVFYDDLLIDFNYNYYKADGMKPYIEFSKNPDCMCFDLIFYTGKKKNFSLSEMKYLIGQFSFRISEKNRECSPVKNTLKDGYLTSVQHYNGFELYLKTPVKPQDWILQMLNDCQKINNIRIEDYARDTEESALQYDFIVNSSLEIPMNIPVSDDTLVNNILLKIENITSMDFDSIYDECKKIIEMLRSNNITIDAAKRFAIRIITNIFEVAKNYSVIFEKSIKYEYSNIYIHLSQNNSIDTIEKTIISTLDKIMLDYRLYLDNNKNKNFIDTITEIIEQNYNNPSMSLTYISEKIGMDESHISKTFHKQTGMSYLQYLTRIRMENAKKLITEGESNSKVIAAKCGYENLSSFLRAFKRYTGSTLGSFKKNI